MRTLSATVGVGLVLITLFLLWTTAGFPPGRSGEPGPALWPRIVLTAIMLLAVLMFVHMLQPRPDRPVLETNLTLPLATMATTMLYLVLLPVLGYFLATPLFLAVTMRILRVRSWHVLAGVSVGFPLGVYLIFGLLMRASLPMGMLDLLLGG